MTFQASPDSTAMWAWARSPCSAARASTTSRWASISFWISSTVRRFAARKAHGPVEHEHQVGRLRLDVEILLVDGCGPDIDGPGRENGPKLRLADPRQASGTVPIEGAFDHHFDREIRIGDRGDQHHQVVARVGRLDPRPQLFPLDVEAGVAAVQSVRPRADLEPVGRAPDEHVAEVGLVEPLDLFEGQIEAEALGQERV